MPEEKSQCSYVFLDYLLNPESRTLHKNKKVIALTKKSYEILLVLINRHGKVVSKQDMMETIWHNQIVTDDAFYKQIVRLKKSLNSKSTIIETIRGVGLRFAPEIQIKTNQQQPNKGFKKRKVKIILMFLVIIALAFLLNLLAVKNKTSQTNPNKTPSISTEKTTNQHINIAILPQKIIRDWLNVGGMSYLTKTIQKHKEIEVLTPELSDKKNSSVLALQLSQSEQIQFSLVIDKIQQNNDFSTQLVLRNENGILAKSKIQAQTLSSLFVNIDNWIIQQLNITSGITFSKDTNKPQAAGYVLESYLRGLAAANNRKFSQAAQFLQTAVNQDKSFFDAWLKLAEVEAELGHYTKALAMTDTIGQLNKFDSTLFNDLYNLKARVLIYMNNLDEAENWLDKSMALSIQQNDWQAQIVSLSSQALIHDRKQELNEETLDIIKRQLKLTYEYNPLPSKIAELNHNLAIVYQYVYDYDNAKLSIQKAIEQYKKTSNSTGLLSSYRALANIYYDLAQTSKALNVLDKADILLEEVDAPITVAHFYMSKARNLYEEGFRKQANDFIKNIDDMSIKYKNNEAKVIALIIQVELQITYKEINAAKKTINQLLQIISINPQEYTGHVDYISALDMYIAARWDKPEYARKKISDYLANQPDLKKSIALYLRRIEAHLLAREGFGNKAIDMLKGLMNVYIEQQHYLDALYISYELLDLQWQYDMHDFLQTLNRAQELSHFDYPFLKYRAQYSAHNKDYLNAVIFLQELKKNAHDFWSNQDQLLLEEYQSNLEKSTD